MGAARSSEQPKLKSSTLQVTLKRSPIGTPERHRLVLRGLGLRRIRQTVVRPDTPQVRGMIHKVGYLLEVVRP
ncbi:MAG: 50S ribosomal protein L30 [Nitrospirales bacterium]|nr:50S ribosomal protein L30 [Nitrospira sp.]MDR4464309.1 50S ribosomal protein L30 [Nitrospira sp.]MDR4466925.1 50S ribosomal protein L30 [Nitrospira sp.]MDR4485845.1 50S ribosomal protein L30 [Nitrospirales bacterium]